MSGLLITFEGVDYSGKTTQIRFLEKYLKEKNLDVVCVRDPGHTIISEKIRNIILDNDNKEMDSIAEAFLYLAARAQLVKEVIKPALNKNKIVLCDRFTDSSLVYQGIGRKIGIEKIELMNNIATKGLKPDITLFLHITRELILKRKKEKQNLDRIEQEKESFYDKIYDGYLNIYKENKERIKLINASLSLEEVQEQIKFEVNKVLAKFNL